MLVISSGETPQRSAPHKALTCHRRRTEAKGAPGVKSGCAAMLWSHEAQVEKLETAELRKDIFASLPWGLI